MHIIQSCNSDHFGSFGIYTSTEHFFAQIHPCMFVSHACRLRTHNEHALGLPHFLTHHWGVIVQELYTLCKTNAKCWCKVLQLCVRLSWGAMATRRCTAITYIIIIFTVHWCYNVYCTVPYTPTPLDASTRMATASFRAAINQFPWLLRSNFFERTHEPLSFPTRALFCTRTCLCSGRFPVSAMFHTMPAHSCNATPNLNNNASRIPLPVLFFMWLRSKVMH